MMNVDEFDKENLTAEANLLSKVDWVREYEDAYGKELEMPREDVELLAEATLDMDGGVFLELLDSLNGFGSIEIKDGEVLAFDGFKMVKTGIKVK